MIAGIAGSLMVISVNAWMNHPGGFRLAGGHGRRRAPVEGAVRQPYLWPELVAHVPRGLHGRGFLVAGAYAWSGCAAAGALRADRRSPCRSTRRARRAGADRRRRLDRARRRRRPADQAGGVRGPRRRRRGRRRSTCSAGTRTATSSTESRSRRLLSLLAKHDPNATVQGLDACRRTTGRRSTSSASRSRRWSGSASLLALLASCTSRELVRRRRLPSRPGSSGRCRRRAALGRRPGRRLGHDRGGPPAVGGLRRDAHGAGGDRGGRHPGRLRDARVVYVALARRARLGAAPAGAHAARAAAEAPPDPASAWPR